MADDYHVYDPENPSVSKSGLDVFRRSPSEYYEQIVLGRRDTETPALLIGQAAHAAVLEPHLYVEDFMEGPTKTRNTKAWKAAQQEHPDKVLLTGSEQALVSRLAASVYNHELSTKYLKNAAMIEKAFYWTDPTTKLRCRCKPDLITKDGFVVDLKTTAGSLDRWRYSARDFRYDVQAAFYTDGLQANNIEVNGFLFMVVSKIRPHKVRMFELHEDDLDEGGCLYSTDLMDMAECYRQGVWPKGDAQKEVEQISLPRR
jgi:hypothetical protein